MDVSERCFFCLDSLENLEHPKNNFHHQNVLSIQALLHYLGASDEAVRFETVTSCENCHQINLKFQKLFRQWKQLEIELSLCVDQIGKLTGIGNRRSQSLKLNDGADETRTWIAKKCKITKINFNVN